MLNELLQEAIRLNVNVKFAELPEPLQGCYLAEHDTILIAAGLSLPEQVETLAHELGHAHYGHGCSDERREFRAWGWALKHLINPEDYAILEQAGLNSYQIAEEMGVTVRVINLWQQRLKRLGDNVYGFARLADYGFKKTAVTS